MSTRTSAVITSSAEGAGAAPPYPGLRKNEEGNEKQAPAVRGGAAAAAGGPIERDVVRVQGAEESSVWECY